MNPLHNLPIFCTFVFNFWIYDFYLSFMHSHNYLCIFDSLWKANIVFFWFVLLFREKHFQLIWKLFCYLFYVQGLQYSSLMAHAALSILKSFQFSSVTQSCLTLCNPMDCSMPGLPVHQQLPEFTQVHVHWVSEAIQPSHTLSSSSPAPNPSQHQCLFQWVSPSNQAAKVLEFQLQHQSFQWIFRTDFL